MEAQSEDSDRRETGGENGVYRVYQQTRDIIDEMERYLSSEYLDDMLLRILRRDRTHEWRYHRQQLWKKVFEDELAPSRKIGRVTDER